MRVQPTEREIEFANDWSRAARLVEKSILLRPDLDPAGKQNPRDRYGPLKWLLSEQHAKCMRIQDNALAVRIYRRQRRARYSELLTLLQAELAGSFTERVSDMDRGRCWHDYETTAAESIRAQACVALLRLALVLHVLHLPGPKDLAGIGCDLMYTALGKLPQGRLA